MFTLTTIADTIRVPAHMFSLPTLVALHHEIDLKYPNRVLMDVGLVICRYGQCLKITNGTCVAGDGGSHHECLFRLVVFRPFVEEVCVGRIVKCTPDGVQVSLGGFFQDIFIPAYWMLRPSHYDEKRRLWLWTPSYDDTGEDEEEEKAEEVEEEKAEEVEEEKTDQVEEQKTDETKDNGNNKSGEEGANKEDKGTDGEENDQGIKQEETPGEEKKGEEEKEEEEAEAEDGDSYEMEIGAEIRFKVKSIHFTQVTNTAKGVQATTTTTAHSHSFPKEQEDKTSNKPLRKRSLSVELSGVDNLPASMHIIASICEDGLGLTSWWTAADEEEEEEEGADKSGEEDAAGEQEEEYQEEYE
jgi:DNA-directed RNA polymerase III subunit RPC8